MPPRLGRRHFLGGAAAFLAAPALAQSGAKSSFGGDVDVAIVGAGAAGIAAARRIAAAGRTYALLEAAPRIGGRIWSEAGRLGVAHDRGAQRISASGRNPLVALGRLENLPLYAPTRLGRLHVGPREARDSEYDLFAAGVSRSRRAIVAAGEAGLDIPASRALPDLRDWQATVAFVLGPLGTSKDLDAVSSMDFARAEDRPDELACRGGLGRLLAAAAKPLAVVLEAPVQRINARGRGVVELETGRGTLRAGAAIVTPSTSVIAAERVRFDPPLPKRTLDAFAGLSLGTHDRLVFELAGNPFALADDQRVLFKAASAGTIALVGRAGGSPLAYAEFCGRFGREVSNRGEAVMAAFVRDVLAEHLGSEARALMGRSEAVVWSRDPWILGGVSAAAPGGGGNRRVVADPVHERIFFAGEAVHESWFGTIAGAWVSGERAADAALALVARAPAAPAGAKSPKAKRPPPR